MPLSRVDRERITDSVLKIQSVRAQLDHLDGSKLSDGTMLPSSAGDPEYYSNLSDMAGQEYYGTRVPLIALGPYADSMHVVADQKGVPLFDRLAIMRHWSDTGAFDLYAAGMDNVLAQRVHDCIGRAIASMIIEAAHLKSVELKTGQ